MGAVSDPLPVKLFVGVLTSADGIRQECARALRDLFGDIELRGGPWPFDQTDYYDRAMGTPLERSFLGFRELVRPDALPRIKTATNRLEQALASRQSRVARPANLDPGYLEQSKIVLASTKNFYHRIALGEGIYGEVTLAYRGGRWEPFPWTFPDFRSGRYTPFLDDLREAYRSQLRSTCWRSRSDARLAERGGFEPPTPV